MKLSEVKSSLNNIEELTFQLPDGKLVPAHFHVTEIGKVDKSFIDCGGKIRFENKISFQLWNANDYNHRLHPEKLKHIIELSEKQLNLQDLEVQVEYQGDTIGVYALEFDGKSFLLKSMFTDCLAKENCGIPAVKKNLDLSSLSLSNACKPGSGCC